MHARHWRQLKNLYIIYLYFAVDVCYGHCWHTQFTIHTHTANVHHVCVALAACASCLKASKHDHFYWILLYFMPDRQKHQTNQLQHKLPNHPGLCGSIIVVLLLLTFHMFGIKWINIKFNSLQMTAYYIIAFKRTNERTDEWWWVPNRAHNYLIDFLLSVSLCLFTCHHPLSS